MTQKTKSQIIRQIMRQLKQAGYPFEPLVLSLDLEFCTDDDGNGLDLERLAGLPYQDFIHDVTGIQAHIDRDTGKLNNCFRPRCGFLDRAAIKSRLEHCRTQLRAECISYDDLTFLQDNAVQIDPEDVELLEAAGVPEFLEERQASDEATP